MFAYLIIGLIGLVIILAILRGTDQGDDHYGD